MIRIIDSHTGGEPTRTVIGGAPDLGGGSVAERLAVFREKHDRFRSAVVNEPRGSDVLVGALLVESVDPACVAGVLFFNNTGCIQMCGHGTIGVIVTLAHLGRIKAGVHRIETCVGIVAATLHEDGRVSVENVVSYRREKAVRVEVPGLGVVRGDLAWGGNWFFLVEHSEPALRLENVAELSDIAGRIRRAVNAQGFPEVDHVELMGPAVKPGGGGRNFMLCPGGAYDRSPCGTGTSAKLACLAADGKLAEGETWVQESVIGSEFRGTFRWEDRPSGRIVPTITGTAYITAEATLILDERDPFCHGLRGDV